MELVAVLRILWARRLVVGFGVILAVAAGMLVTHRARGAAGSGFGSVKMVLDTPDSQLVDAMSKNADSLPTRAALLANTLATDAGEAAVARSAGVAADQLTVLGPAATAPPVVETPLNSRLAAVASTAPTPYVVEALADGQTAIISIEAYAPTVSQAARLARGAAAGLRKRLVIDGGSRTHGFVLNTTATLTTRQLATTSHASLLALGAALMILVLWCAWTVIATGVARRMRRLEVT